MSTLEDIPTYGKHPKSSPPFHRTVPRSSPFLRTCVVRTTTMMKLTEYPFNREIRGAQFRPAYLTECIYQLVLESQVPHKTVNLLFTIPNENIKLTGLGGGVTF